LSSFFKIICQNLQCRQGIPASPVPNTRQQWKLRTSVEITAPDLLIIYKMAKIKLVKINPSETGNPRIGHSGFLSRKFNSTLWPQFLNYLDNKAP
jgi:hypothetical protein